MTRTAKDILKEAILLETRGKAFYKTVAEKCDSPSAKKIFEMMAEEEDEHIKFLSKQFINYTKTHSFIKPDAPKEDPEETVILKVLTDKVKKEINAASFESAAISSAIDFEMNAVNLYKSRAKEATDPNEKELYTILAAWEGEHSRMLVDINNSLKEDIWNDNNFWPF
ncbi:MAG TPA: rubrerythrin [Lutibacter sp.]|nr:rubrerythrin [Lutibacter sp.]